MGRADGPLSGVTVLDFTHHAAGPMCTMLLGDFGADVIKVEPVGGEPYRSSGTVRQGGEHVGFLALNRNKRSVELDLKQEHGRQSAQELLRRSDVVVQNFRPGTAERLGIGYEDAARVNPRIVYCALSAFGRDGVYKSKQGLDIVLQAMSGLMSITGDPAGEAVPAGAPVSDIYTGTVGALGILLGLMERDRTGAHQYVDVSMYNAMAALLALRFQQYFGTGQDLSRVGSAHPQASPWNAFRASDGDFVIAASTEGFWRRMCLAIGAAHLQDDPRFETTALRVENREVLRSALNRIFEQRPRDHWLRLLDEAEVPNGPVNTLAEVVDDPQSSAVETFVTFDHPTAGSVTSSANPIRLGGRQAQVDRPPPLVGQHTAEILQALRDERTRLVDEDH